MNVVCMNVVYDRRFSFPLLFLDPKDEVVDSDGLVGFGGLFE